MTPDGKLTILYEFKISNANGATPAGGLVQGTDGNFYGTTSQGGDLSAGCSYGCGTVFRMTPGGTVTSLHEFDVNDGAYLGGELFHATNGVFYGTTREGGDLSCNPNGSVQGCGTIFSLSVGLDSFVSFVRSYGKVGSTESILGRGFTGTSSVLFNGTAAHFTVTSDTSIQVTVPTDATTGYVSVTTPSRTLKSNKPFMVIP